MGAMASQITSLTIVYSAVYSGADQRKHQSSASLAFVRGINRWPVISPHKWLVTRKMFPFDDVITELTINDIDDHIVSWTLHASYIWGPFYQHGLTLIPRWLSNYILYKVWDEIACYLYIPKLQRMDK